MPNKKYYMVYNHWDSYPSGLGNDLVKQLKQAIEDGTIEEWKVKVLELEDVSGTTPTEEQINFLKENTNLEIGEDIDNWYELLKGTQDSLQNMLDAKYFESQIEDYSEPRLGIFIEFCYVVNLDTNTLDFYGDRCSFSLDNLPTWVYY